MLKIIINCYYNNKINIILFLLDINQFNSQLMLIDFFASPNLIKRPLKNF